MIYYILWSSGFFHLSTALIIKGYYYLQKEIKRSDYEIYSGFPFVVGSG